MVVKFNMSMPEWLFKDAIGNNLDNRSKRIVELIIKGYISEKIESERLKSSRKISVEELSSKLSPATPFSNFVNIPDLSVGFASFLC